RAPRPPRAVRRIERRSPPTTSQRAGAAAVARARGAARGRRVLHAADGEATVASLRVRWRRAPRLASLPADRRSGDDAAAVDELAERAAEPRKELARSALFADRSASGDDGSARPPARAVRRAHQGAIASLGDRERRRGERLASLRAPRVRSGRRQE